MDSNKRAQAISGRKADCPARSGKVRILLIDDDDLARTTVALMLEQLGYEALQANNGETGLALFREELPPLVITDLIMPIKEGIETLIEIKAERPGTRVLAISGGGRLHSRSLLTMARHLGADHTLSKPFGIRELASAIDKVLVTQNG
jgi:DNA-binding response OmpR family regulator